jgi:hypothetical protein
MIDSAIINMKVFEMYGMMEALRVEVLEEEHTKEAHQKEQKFVETKVLLFLH